MRGVFVVFVHSSIWVVVHKFSSGICDQFMCDYNTTQCNTSCIALECDALDCHLTESVGIDVDGSVALFEYCIRLE